MTFYTIKALDDLTIFTTPASRRKSVQFQVTWDRTLRDLRKELDHLHATDVVFEVAASAADVRLDGMLRSKAKVTHPGVRLSFQTRDHGQMSFTCDTYEARYYGQMPDWQANVRAIGLTLEAARAMDRYGATQGKQYAGFAALPPGQGATAMGGMTRQAAFEVLQLHAFPTRELMETLEQAEHVPGVLPSVYRRARAATHPDRHGGDQTFWDQVEQAARVLGLD